MLNKRCAFEGTRLYAAMGACLRRMEFSCRRAVLIVANQKIRPPGRMRGAFAFSKDGGPQNVCIPCREKHERHGHVRSASPQVYAAAQDKDAALADTP